MNKTPNIVIVSCSNTKPKSLIKLITKEKNIGDTKEGAIKHQWTIDTKYYRVNVNIFGIDEMFKRTREFNENVEAVIIHIDTNKESGLIDTNLWDDLLNECNPEIKLLVANYCTDDTRISKGNILRWCLKKDFEFIELYPNISKIESEEEIIKEKVGVDRIIEALQTHVWPNLEMKKADHNKKTVSKTGKEENIDEILSMEGVDDFTELFTQLHMMKDSIQAMPANQRKQCAEQIVTTFWKAIGGEEEEILDS